MKFLWLFLIWSLPVFAQEFLPGTEDVPLMEGLTKVEETASFDNPAERMVLVNAETTLKPATVFKFYQKSLVNLGWKETRPHYFERGSDSLLIEITSGQKSHLIQFQLSQVNP